MTPKRILVVPVGKKVEALRMAAGLTLLDDQVSIAALDTLPSGKDADEQMEALEFSEVPVAELRRDYDALARRIADSDVVFFV